MPMPRKPKTKPLEGDVMEEAPASEVTETPDTNTEDDAKKVKHEAGQLTFYFIDN